MDRGGGQVVSVLAFYSNNPRSNPTDAYRFCAGKTKNKQKYVGVGPF